jgi:hypothetical protein
MSLGRFAGPVWAGLLSDTDVNDSYASGAIILFVGFLIGLVWLPQGRKHATSVGLQHTGE